MKRVMSNQALKTDGLARAVEGGASVQVRSGGAAVGRMIAILAAVAMLAMVRPHGVARADTGGAAMGVAKAMVDRALSVLANKSAPVVQRRKDLREAIENNFDFTEMSRSALGYHWRGLTPSQRQDFTHLFTAFIEDAYLSKIQDYSGQKVDFLGQSQLAPGYVQINTNIIEPGKNPIAVNYLMLQKDSSWKIYDVTVDAISIIANYRNQFNRVINDQGFDKLMADLRSKQQQLASSLGATN